MLDVSVENAEQTITNVLEWCFKYVMPPDLDKLRLGEMLVSTIQEVVE